ncbi:1,4-dihydroxy-2-naphthoate polyprenyltransferase [Niallia sp. 01092]|uniref:1,4-dihydroxy-2-naphthoate polyprenyltransferase n=1 Tax=unclassified Niallia TaxID=2837522 RepID=UPI003FD4915A
MENVTRELQPRRKVLWQLTRPHTLTASFIPVLIGTVLAMQYEPINISIFLAMLFACLFIQIATNLFNEYYDFIRGLDTVDSVGIGGAIVRHGMKPRTVLQYALMLYGVSLLLGIYICISSSWWIALVGLFGMAIGYLYTGGPLPIAYTPFGELFSGVCMGSIFVLVSFYIQTNMINIQSMLISVPIAFLVGSINLANNIRDIDEDILGGRKTIAILIGYDKAVTLLAVLFALSYIWIIALILFGLFSPWVLIVLCSIKKPIQAIIGFKGDRSQTPVAMKSTALTNTLFGFFLSIGLILQYLTL